MQELNDFESPTTQLESPKQQSTINPTRQEANIKPPVMRLNFLQLLPQFAWPQGRG
jgi:hypothetical protein